MYFEYEDKLIEFCENNLIENEDVKPFLTEYRSKNGKVVVILYGGDLTVMINKEMVFCNEDGITGLDQPVLNEELYNYIIEQAQ